MTATDSRSLAHLLAQRDDASLAALFATRQVAPTVDWHDMFDAAEALLDAALIERALGTLTRTDVDVLDAAVASGAVPAGPMRDAFFARALVDADGVPYGAVARTLAGLVRVDAAVASSAAPAGTSGDALEAERAFAATGSLADILHIALSTPLARIGAGTLGAADRRRLIDLGAVDDAPAADELVAIAEQTGLIAGVERQWLVTARGAAWLRTATLDRWLDVATALVANLPAAVRASAARHGGWIPLVGWAGAYPFDASWPAMAERTAALLRRWVIVDATGAPATWSQPAAAGGSFDAAALSLHLPPEVDRVYLQNDLTAIAPGALAPRVDIRLRTMARRESRAQAASYRFTAESLGDALTAGETAPSLRAFLLEISLTGLPQPLAYEIERTASRHGSLRVGPDAQGRTRITSDDATLLRTIAVDQVLRPLGLVHDGDALTSRTGPDTAFWMLADARYPVVAVDADGIRRDLDRHRLAPDPAPSPDPVETYRDLLERLRAGASADADATWLGRELEQAVRARATIVVAVQLPDGTEREFTIEATGLGGGRLRGRDKNVDVERTLPVSSISSLRAG
ncbi:MAG: helicase-associated domain-containing protein [Microbacterium sp.]